MSRNVDNSLLVCYIYINYINVSGDKMVGFSMKNTISSSYFLLSLYLWNCIGSKCRTVSLRPLSSSGIEGHFPGSMHT